MFLRTQAHRNNIKTHRCPHCGSRPNGLEALPVNIYYCVWEQRLFLYIHSMQHGTWCTAIKVYKLLITVPEANARFIHVKFRGGWDVGMSLYLGMASWSSVCTNKMAWDAWECVVNWIWNVPHRPVSVNSLSPARGTLWEDWETFRK